ncbi:MAG: hypothetical protein NTZ59_02410 [Bacteroidetes bacterium]|nr:hypothetical protein [Bacteroidota bacterium]
MTNRYGVRFFRNPQAAAFIAGANITKNPAASPNSATNQPPSWLNVVQGLGSTAAQIITATKDTPAQQTIVLPNGGSSVTNGGSGTPQVIVQQPATAAQDEPKKDNTMTFVLVAVGVVLLVVVGFALIKRK